MYKELQGVKRMAYSPRLWLMALIMSVKDLADPVHLPRYKVYISSAQVVHTQHTYTTHTDTHNTHRHTQHTYTTHTDTHRHTHTDTHNTHTHTQVRLSCAQEHA